MFFSNFGHNLPKNISLSNLMIEKQTPKRFFFKIFQN